MTGIKYWLDKCFYQVFERSGREWLILNVLGGGSGSCYISAPNLKKNFRDDSSGNSSSSRIPLLIENGQVSTETASSGQTSSLTISVVRISSSNITSLPQEFQSSGVSDADREGIYLCLAEGYVLLTNDYKHIVKKLRSYSSATGMTLSPCFSPSDILAANALKGIITVREADVIWRTWKSLDPRYVPKEYSTFSDFYSSVDKDLLYKYFAIES